MTSERRRFARDVPAASFLETARPRNDAIEIDPETAQNSFRLSMSNVTGPSLTSSTSI